MFYKMMVTTPSEDVDTKNSEGEGRFVLIVHSSSSVGSANGGIPRRRPYYLIQLGVDEVSGECR